MSTKALTALFCDADGCDALFVADGKLASVTRAQAKRCGWTQVHPPRSGGGRQAHGWSGPRVVRDLCKLHSEAES